MRTKEEEECETCKKEIDRVQIRSVKSLDVCFMVDFTNTMDYSMEAVKRQLDHFLNNVRLRYPDSVIKVSLVGYRDIDDEKPFVIKDFTTNPSDISAIIEMEKGEGGGDIPEDVRGALMEVRKLSWSSDRRILVHITDAPAHGNRYHSLDVYDKHSHQLVPGDESCEDILVDLSRNGVCYLLITICKESTDLMAQVFRNELERHNFSMEYSAIGDSKEEADKIFLLIERFVFTSLRSADDTD